MELCTGSVVDRDAAKVVEVVHILELIAVSVACRTSFVIGAISRSSLVAVSLVTGDHTPKDSQDCPFVVRKYLDRRYPP